jgi:hypothetical protein
MSDESKNTTREENDFDENGITTLTISNKYIPALEALRKVWGYEDLSKTVNGAVLLMIYLTDLRQNKMRFYVQDEKGNTKEMPLLKEDDISEEIEKVTQKSSSYINKYIK